MGLRTASVRHPHVMVMAPALTKASQQSFNNLRGKPDAPPRDKCDDVPEAASCAAVHSDEGGVLQRQEQEERGSGAAIITQVDKEGEQERQQQPTPGGGMSEAPSSMGETNRRRDSMGLQETVHDALLAREKGELRALDSSSEIGQSELMQVMKSFESDGLPAEADAIFPIGTLASFEKDFLNDVDVLAMEEQLYDNANTVKETQTKEMINELSGKQVKLERKLDFMLRRVRKLQSKHMGQHFSEEVAGVYEHVHRLLRRARDPSASSQLSVEGAGAAAVTSPPPATSTPIVSVEKLKPISESTTRNLVRKLGATAQAQANPLGRQRPGGVRYFGSGSTDSNSYRGAVGGIVTIPAWRPEHKQELQRVAGALRSEMQLVQQELDSEATVSSSGGESCDEFQPYNNPHQQYLSIQKRAAWKYATGRAAVASRWTWLQAQISDLEYRIRQYSELHKKIRASKGAIQLGGASPVHSSNVAPPPTSPTAVNGYRGQLPGAVKPMAMDEEGEAVNGACTTTLTDNVQCCRTRPLLHVRKRKLLQTWGLHAVSKKAARPATMRCGCVPSTYQCTLCTGRTDPTRPRDLPDYLSQAERIALLDPGFHAVCSFPQDTSASVHLEAIMKTPEWQQRSLRTNIKALKYMTKADRSEKANHPVDLKKPPEFRRKYNRQHKSTTGNDLTPDKIKNKHRGRKPQSLNKLKKRRHAERMAFVQSMAMDSTNEDYEHLNAKHDSPNTSPLLTMQTIASYNRRSSRISSYDIDNIVIPYSVAASTRVEKLPYKEILTPKWRLVDPEFSLKYHLKNGAVKEASEEPDDVEDLSEEAVAIRHDKSEHDERKKFLSYIKFPLGVVRQRSHKRTDSRAESSGANTPDPMSPQTGDAMGSTTPPVTSPPATPIPRAVTPLALATLPPPTAALLPPATPLHVSSSLADELPSVEDLSEEAVAIRHDKSEHDERKKFLSYIKFPENFWAWAWCWAWCGNARTSLNPKS